MPTLQQKIAEKFLAGLSGAKVLEDDKIDQLRVLLASGKKLKADELAKLFAEPSQGDIK